VSVDFIKLETRPMRKYTINLSKDGSYAPTVKDYIIDYLQKQADTSTVARLYLKGQITQEQSSQLNINEIFQATGDIFFHLGLERKELDVEGFGRVFAERLDNPIDAFVKRLDSLIAEAGDAEKGQLEQVKELGRKYLEEARA